MPRAAKPGSPLSPPASDDRALRRRLRDSQRSFRAVADYTYDWESWVSPAGHPIWINPAIERLTGYEVGECLAMANYPLPIIVLADRKRMADLFASALSGSTGNDVEFRIRHKSGTLHWMAVSWQPIYDEQGVALGYRTSIRDIQERKAAEAALRRSEQRSRRMEEKVRQHALQLEALVVERSAEVLRLEEQRAQMSKLAALGELAAGVAHEINNPLAGIKNVVHLLLDEGLSESQRELLKAMNAEVDRMSGIVRQMYQLYRYQPLEANHFDLSAALREAVHVLHSTAQEAQVGVRFEMPEELFVILPQHALQQVAHNLLRNAIEASHPGGQVEVSVHDVDAYVEWSVRDHGPGIAADVVPRIFEPFYTTKRNTPQAGLGLGLAVTRNLVTAMGGTVEAHSTPGQGAVFTVRLPKISESQSHAFAASRPSG